MSAKLSQVSLMIWAAIMLAACGGSNNNIGGGTLPDQATGGIWVGTWVGGAGGSEDAFILSTDVDPVTGVGRFSMFLSPSNIQIAGTLRVNGSMITGTATAFIPPEPPDLPNEATTAAIEFDGDLLERNSISGSWESDAGETGTFDLVYDEQHQRGADLSLLDGTWTLLDLDQNPIATYDILDGMTFRQSGDCTSSGIITIPDPAYNIYDWEATVTSIGAGSCPVEGQYTGLGVLTDQDDNAPAPVNDEFDVLVNSDTLARPLLLIRDP